MMQLIGDHARAEGTEGDDCSAMIGTTMMMVLMECPAGEVAMAS